MEERRSMRRFDLELPCVMTPIGDDSGKARQWTTQNISAGGAFINAVNAMPVGMRLKIEILIPRPAGSPTVCSGARVHLCGEVIRANNFGTAIEFDDQYQISQIDQTEETAGKEVQSSKTLDAMPAGARGEVIQPSFRTPVPA